MLLGISDLTGSNSNTWPFLPSDVSPSVPLSVNCIFILQRLRISVLSKSTLNPWGSPIHFLQAVSSIRWPLAASACSVQIASAACPLPGFLALPLRPGVCSPPRSQCSSYKCMAVCVFKTLLFQTQPRLKPNSWPPHLPELTPSGSEYKPSILVPQDSANPTLRTPPASAPIASLPFLPLLCSLLSNHTAILAVL